LEEAHAFFPVISNFLHLPFPSDKGQASRLSACKERRKNMRQAGKVDIPPAGIDEVEKGIWSQLRRQRNKAWDSSDIIPLQIRMNRKSSNMKITAQNFVFVI
jgi:hypothetical protein